MTSTRFTDRAAAGVVLAARLESRLTPPLVVAAIPRGGLAVALPIALRLRAPLTLAYARKLTTPMSPEFALGAVAEDGAVLLEASHARSVGATHDDLERARAAAHAEIQRERDQYRATPLAQLAPTRTVVLVDDGLATGLTMRAAIAHARRCGARDAVVAVPCAAKSTVRKLEREGTRVIALVAASGAFAVGAFYDDFHPVSDDEAMALLAHASAGAPAAGDGPAKPPAAPADDARG